MAELVNLALGVAEGGDSVGEDVADGVRVGGPGEKLGVPESDGVGDRRVGVCDRVRVTELLSLGVPVPVDVGPFVAEKVGEGLTVPDALGLLDCVGKDERLWLPETVGVPLSSHVAVVGVGLYVGEKVADRDEDGVYEILCGGDKVPERDEEEVQVVVGVGDEAETETPVPDSEQLRLGVGEGLWERD